MIVQTTILCIVAGKHGLLHALSYKPLLGVHAGSLLMWYAAKVTACQQCTSVQPATHIANCTDNAPWHLLVSLSTRTLTTGTGLVALLPLAAELLVSNSCLSQLL